MAEREEWRRDGTLVRHGATECDVTNGEDWITVKGSTAERSRELANELVRLLNDKKGE